MKKKKPSKPARVDAASPPASSDAPPLWPRLWPYLFLILLAFGIYANALGNGFVSDDDAQLLRNPMVTDWRQIPQIFQHDVWSFAEHGTVGNYYRPIQIVLYMALYYAFGFNAFVFHLMMLLIHAGNTLLVYTLERRWLSGRSAALVAGIVFAVHPIHSEPVVWIAVLPDVFLTLLVLLALLLFVRCGAAPRGRHIAGLAGLFLLALFTKEPGAMLVPLLAGYEFFYLGRRLWPLAPSGQAAAARTLWDNWPLYASLMGVFGLYALLRIHALGGMAPAQGIYFNLHGKALVLSIIVILGRYLGKLFLPTHLNYFHVFEATVSITPLVVASLAVELGLIAAIFLLRARPAGAIQANSASRFAGAGSPADILETPRRGSRPLISYGIFFILTPLAPALNITGVGENVFTERYLYLPSVGFVMVVALAWEWLAHRHRTLAWTAVTAIVAASAWIVLPRNLDWHDDLRLFTVSVQESPGSATVVGNLGGFYGQHGEYDLAIEKSLLAMRLKPQVALYHNNLGIAYAKKGRYQEALVELRKAIELTPSYAEAHWHLGLTLEWLGDITGAVGEYRRALELRPDYDEVYVSLALLRAKDKDYPAAIDLFHRAIAANPRSFEAYINLGVAYNNTNRYADGTEAFRKAIALEPANPSLYLAHYNLGLAYWHLNAFESAAAEFSKSLQLKPDFNAAKESFVQLRHMLNPQSTR